MINLKNILSEEKKFKARSADTGKIVYYKSKENMDKALDAGEAEPLDKGSGKADDSDKVKGADVFAKTPDKAGSDTAATIDDYEKIKFKDKDGKNQSVSAWIAKAQKDTPANIAYQKELAKRKAGSAKGDDSTKTKKKSTKSEPDYDEAKFQLDKIFPEDNESIRIFQDIEDNGTAEEMEDYINSYADEETLQRYGIRKPEQIKKLAQQIMGESSSSKLKDIVSEKSKGLWANIHAKRKRGEKGARKGSKAYKKAKKAADNINRSEGKLTEDVFKSFLQDDSSFKLHMATNTDKRKSVKARKTDKTWDDGVPVLKYIARAPKKDSPLPKGKFKIIEDNKYGWWYYQVGNTWYGISQKDYGTPPFEY